jgi:ubiquinone biosynthesis protein UbiJ
MIESGLVASLNHLLAREAWARDKLAPFAGEIVELRLSPLPTLRLAIAEGGLSARAEAGLPPTLTLTARPELLAALVRGAGEGQGDEHLMRAVDVSGNARLAAEILVLLRHLRWDAEEDLSRVFGDILAHRMVGAAREFAGWQREAVRRLSDNAAVWAVEERRILVARPEFEDFSREVAALRDELARIEQRIARLPA